MVKLGVQHSQHLPLIASCGTTTAKVKMLEKGYRLVYTYRCITLVSDSEGNVCMTGKHMSTSRTDLLIHCFILHLNIGLLKRKNSGGRENSHSSPESTDSDYSNGQQSASKRLNMESPLTLPTVAPSPTDILTRAFPGLSSTVLEHVLKGCNGNVLQAIEVIVQYNATRPTTNGMLGQSNLLPAQPPHEVSSQAPPHVPVPTSGSHPPLFKFNYVNGQYRYLMPPSLMPLTSYMLPTPNGLGLPFPQFQAEMQNHQFKPVESAPQTEVNGESGNAETKPVMNVYHAGVCKSCGQDTNPNENLCTSCSASFNRK